MAAKSEKRKDVRAEDGGEEEDLVGKKRRVTEKKSDAKVEEFGTKRRKSEDVVIPEGTEVAAVTKSSGKIVIALGSVVRYIPRSKKYEVLDVGEQEDSDEELPETKWKISRRYLRVLSDEGDFEFKKGSRVTAIYPDSTCFYPATVVEPAKKCKDETCSLEFDFEEEDDKIKKVPAKYVLPIDAFKG